MELILFQNRSISTTFGTQINNGHLSKPTRLPLVGREIMSEAKRKAGFERFLTTV